MLDNLADWFALWAVILMFMQKVWARRFSSSILKEPKIKKKTLEYPNVKINLFDSYSLTTKQ